jgi:hypothetical protein
MRWETIGKTFEDEETRDAQAEVQPETCVKEALVVEQARSQGLHEDLSIGVARYTLHICSVALHVVAAAAAAPTAAAFWVSCYCSAALRAVAVAAPHRGSTHT